MGDNGLNVLINNAGVLPVASRTDSFYTDEMAECYETNVIAPTKLTKAILPLLKKAGANDCGGNFTVKHALVVNTSSLVGSIAEVSYGLLLPYRCSKVALNMVTKSLSCELKKFNIAVISMHPGWVKTDMGTDAAPLTKSESMGVLVQTLMKITPEHTGHFIAWDGKPIPW